MSIKVELDTESKGSAISSQRAKAGLSSSEAKALLEKHGRNELEENTRSKWLLLYDQLSGPLPIGIWIAIIVQAALGNPLDVVVLLSLQFINAGVGYYENNKSSNAVKALKESLKPMAQVKRDGEWMMIEAGLLVPDDLITLSSGSAVPADCVVISGSIEVDQSSLTGESLPVRMKSGATPKMGSTVTKGEGNAIITETGMATSYGNTAKMLQAQNGKKSKDGIDGLLLQIVMILLVMSLLLCTITFIYMVAQGEDFKSALSFNVVILVSSIPIAIEVVVTATLALGSRELSSHSAIVTNLSAIERLAGMSILCSDKTGTLTLNEMIIQKQCLTFPKGGDRETLLMYSALATRWNEPAKDAIDTMILSCAPLARCNRYVQNSFIPFDSESRRTESVCTSPEGVQFTVMKGAPDALLAICINQEEIRAEFMSTVNDSANRGIRCLAIATTNNQSGELSMAGLLTFLDPPRKDAKHTIALADSYGVSIKMITGDHQAVAVNTAMELQLGSGDIVPCSLPELDMSQPIPKDLGDSYGPLIEGCDGMSCALPGQKFVMVEALRQRDHIVGMTGDGVNDAPALKHSHCGIAVVGATDAARAAADIVLTTPGLSAIVEAILIARRVHMKMGSFLVYRIAATLQLLFFFFIAVMFVRPSSFQADFPKFWSMPIIGLISITLLNDGTIISIAYDSVPTSRTPLHWNVRKLWITSSCLGAVACFSSLFLLVIALASSTFPFLRIFGMFDLTFEQIVTVMFLKIAVSDFLTLFSARTGVKSCFSSRPSWHVFASCSIALGASTILALTWPFPTGHGDINGSAISFAACLFVWVYCIIVFIIQDNAKVQLFSILTRFGFDSSEPKCDTLSKIITVGNGPVDDLDDI